MLVLDGSPHLRGNMPALQKGAACMQSPACVDNLQQVSEVEGNHVQSIFQVYDVKMKAQAKTWTQ